MAFSLSQRINRQRPVTRLQSLPIRQQFCLMQFGPRLDHAALSFGQRPRHQFNRINAIDRNLILIVSMKVRRLMRCANLRVHANDNAEKTAEFWHQRILLRNRASAQRTLSTLFFASVPETFCFIAVLLIE